MKCRHKPGGLQTHHELLPTSTGAMRCLAQPLRGSTTTKKASDSTARLNRLHTHTYSPKRLAHPRSPMPPLSALTTRAAHVRPHLTAALASVPYGVLLVLVRVRVIGRRLHGDSRYDSAQWCLSTNTEAPPFGHPRLWHLQVGLRLYRIKFTLLRLEAERNATWPIAGL